ncbi:MAG: spheroidene monooxygenase [Rubrivivax sp.]
MATLGREDPGVAVLLMFRLRPRAVPWALWRLARGAPGLGQAPGLRFARVLGSGQQGGFGLKPGLDCQGVFAFFDTEQQARDFVDRSPSAQAYRARALEHFSVVLQATSARGSWAGHRLAAHAPAPPQGPVAALTRAAIRPSRAWSFWRHSPATEAELAAAPGCLLAVGLGEAPFLRQATFSLWESVAAMDGYARHGSHQRAIQASWQRGFFSEWMFARFRPLSLHGAWHGVSVDGCVPH